MIIRNGIFETNSSSTHALCVGKGGLQEPYRLINEFIHKGYDYADDVMLEEDYFKSNLNVNDDDIWEDNKVTIKLRRFENIGRVFRIYGTTEAKLNFIWSCLLCNTEFNGFTKYIVKFLNYLDSIPYSEIKFLDVKFHTKEYIDKHPEYDNTKYDLPHILAKLNDNRYIIGLDSYGYIPKEEIKVILDDEKLFWNLVLGNSKIYLGSDESDLFEDLNFSEYAYNLVGGSDSGCCYPTNIFQYRNYLNKIGCYTNGNYKTTIYGDGTRIRELQPHSAYYNQGLYRKDKYKLNEIDMMEPEFVENIDLKITNFCENNCEFCYAESNIQGKDADYEDVISVIDSMKPYTEIAFGGGNVLTYARLEDILRYAKSKDIIANITVRDIDILGKYRDIFENLCKEQLVRAVGVSITNIENLCKMDSVETNRVQLIAHMIIGIHTIEDIKTVIDKSKFDGVLLLGYKSIGKGLKYYEDNKDKIVKSIANIQLSDLMEIDTYKKIAFDNLAIDQLKLDVENKYCDIYQGEDGKFSMYIDLVESKYAKSSLVENKEYFYSLEEAFNQLKQNRLVAGGN